MNNNNFCQEAKDFIKYLFKIYLEDRNFSLFLSMLHEDITWIGTGKYEICKNYQEAVKLLEEERDSWDGHFKILEQWYQASSIHDNCCVVFGELSIKEDGLNTILMDMHSRFSMVCVKEDGQIKLYQAHFSVPNEAQEPGEFVHKKQIEDYNILLEEKLQERTQMLKDRTNELQTLTNNVEVAIIRCSFTKELHVTFANDGLFRMIGYTREQFEEEKGNSLAALMNEEDAENMLNSLLQQTANGQTAASVNCLNRRDGDIAWILIKGTVTTDVNKTVEFQGVLTDITEQQKQEEALQISEKRYEVAMQLSDITMFEYNIITKQLILFDREADMYSTPNIIENGVETFVRTGIIEADSVEGYLEMYRKICAGEPFASCYVNTKDKDGVVREFKLSLNNVYDKNGNPISAVGVRKNVEQMRQLQKEKEFGKTLVSNKVFICEADVTNNSLIRINDEWAASIGITLHMSFSEMIEKICKEVIAPEHQLEYLRKFSKENIEEAYKMNRKLISYIYRRVSADKKQYVWIEATINIIKDEVKGNYSIRYYIMDISEQKRKEQKALEEQRLYDTMIAKAMQSYEVNITQDIILSAQNNWDAMTELLPLSSYSAMVLAACEKEVYLDDRDKFIEMFSRRNVLKSFEEGIREMVYQYRKLNEHSTLVWVSCTLHLYEDPNTNEVKGYSYIEDIHDKKVKELELQYKAEHDSLTGFYNKSTTEKLINQFLNYSEFKSKKHAFIMLDIDYFKSINDNFGHSFGDAVLAQVAAKINMLFREDDIIGRVGGDEFVVFMKNIYNNNIVISKAKEICSIISETYYKEKESFKISASVGIALYQEHGKNYRELYEHSDSALYVSKKNGRDQFTMYDKSMALADSQVKMIDSCEYLEIKTFDENVSEYIFRILYESQDKEASINAVLKLVGKYFNISRAYIFEDTEDGKFTSNTFEWCGEGVLSQMENLQKVPYAELDHYHANFNQDGVFYMADIAKANPSLQKILEPQNVKCMLQYSIVRYNKFAGFIGFDQCDYIRIPTKKEISDFRNISQILGVFIMEMRALKRRENMENMAMSIVNGVDSFAYVCDTNTYEVYFINDKTKKLATEAEVGQVCYKAFWNRETPCEACPMKDLKKEGDARNSIELYNTNLDVWVKATASWIDWQGKENVCLVDSIDITDYKKTCSGED